jgi:hypothetical protein
MHDPVRFVWLHRSGEPSELVGTALLQQTRDAGSCGMLQRAEFEPAGPLPEVDVTSHVPRRKIGLQELPPERTIPVLNASSHAENWAKRRGVPRGSQLALRSFRRRQSRR